jgi:hypothetical protein
MFKVTVFLTVLFAAQVAGANDPTAVPQQFVGQVTIAKGTPAATEKIDDLSIEQLQKQMLAAQESQLQYKARELELLLKTELKVLGDPESSAQMARYIQNLYESLVKEGFSKDQALQIASHVPFPTTPSAHTF